MLDPVIIEALRQAMPEKAYGTCSEKLIGWFDDLAAGHEDLSRDAISRRADLVYGAIKIDLENAIFDGQLDVAAVERIFRKNQ